MPQDGDKGKLVNVPGIQAPIDTSRPRLSNDDGTSSTELSITIEQDGQYFNIPTIVGGQRRTNEEAIALFRSGGNAAVGTFGNLGDALAQAGERSEAIGVLRGPPPAGGDDRLEQLRQRIRNRIQSSPEAPAQAAPLDAIRIKREQSMSNGLRTSLRAAMTTDPAAHGKALQLASDTGVPPAVAPSMKPIDVEEATRIEQQLYGIAGASPELAEWLSNPHNMAIARNDVGVLRGLMGTVAKMRQDNGYLDDLAEAHEAGWERMRTSMIHLKVANGNMTPEEGAHEVFLAHRRIAALEAATPGYAREFQAESEADTALVAKRLGELSEASGLGYIDAIANLSDAVILSWIGKVMNPKGFARSQAEQVPNVYPSMIGGAAGAVAGVGVASVPLAAVGVFGGGVAVEFGAWLDEGMAKRGVDFADEASILAAYRDAPWMASISEQAGNKAVVTASGDALMVLAPVGGVALKRAAGETLGAAGKRIAKGAAVAGAVETTSEAGFEFAGRVAAVGAENVTVEDAAQSIDEGLFALGQSVSAVGLNSVARSLDMPRKELVKTVRKAAQARQAAQAVTEAAKAQAGTQAAKLAPSRVRKLMEVAAGKAGVGTATVSRAAWDTYYTGKGVSPSVAYQELTGDPRGYHEAGATGEMVLPTAAAMEKLEASGDLEALMPNVRMFADGPTLAEAAESMRALPEELKAAQDEANVLFQEETALSEEAASLEAEEAADVTTPESVAAEGARSAEIEQALGISASIPLEAVTAEALGQVADLIEGAAAEPAAAGLASALGLDVPTMQARAAEVAPAMRELAALRDKVQKRATRSTRRAEIAARQGELAAQAQAKEGQEALLFNETVAGLVAAGRPEREARIEAAIRVKPLKVLAERYPAFAAVEGLAEKARLVFLEGGAPGSKGGKVLAQAGKKRQGSLRMLGKWPARIFETRFYKEANRSTFFHEFGHYMLEVLGDLASIADAPQALKDDYALLLADLGVTDRAKIGTKQHEQLAREMEAYFFKGEAPSLELRRLFATIAKWMLAIYKSIRNLGVELSPEVQGVFDRLFATDEEIRAAQEAAGVKPLFVEAAGSGMTEGEFAEYQEAAQQAGDAARAHLMRQLMADMEAEKQQARRETLDVLRKEVAATIDTHPMVVAHDNIKAWTKIDRAAAADLYNGKAMKALDDAGLLADGTGLTPDTARELLGLSSVDELATGLILAANKEKLVEVIARQRLAQEHPELMRTKAVKSLAKKAVENDAPLKQSIRELKALRMLNEQAQATKAAAGAQVEQRLAAFDAIPTLQDIRKEAEAILNSKTYRELRPSQHRAAAQRLSGEAAKHFRAGDPVEAARAVRMAALNRELARMADNLREQMEKDSNAVAAIRSPGRQEAMGKAGDGWRVQANQLALRFGLGTAAQVPAEPWPIMSWLEGLQAESREDNAYVIVPDVPAWLLDDKARSWKTLNPDQMRDLRMTVEQIYKIGRDRHKAMAGDRTQSLLDRAAGVAAQVEVSHAELDRAFQAKPTWPQKFAAEHAPIDRYVFEIDGKAGGPLAEAFLYLRNDGEAEVESRRRAANVEINASFKGFTLPERAAMGRHRAIPGVGRELSRENVMVMALYEGSASGRQRNRVTFTDAEIDAALRSMSTKEAAWTNKTWAFQEAYWPESSALIGRVWGIIPPKIEAAPFAVVNDAGERLEFTGGYSRVSYHGERANQLSEAEIASQIKQGAMIRNTVKLGSRHERVQQTQLQARYDFGVVIEGVGQTISALSLIERLHDMNFVLRDKRVETAIVGRYGQEVYNQFKASFKALAEGRLAAQSSGEQMAAWIRSGTVIAKLGIKVSTNLVNMTGIMNSVEVLGPGVMKEAAALSANPRAFLLAVKEMHAESPTMASRATTFNREEADIRQRLNKRFDLEAFNRVPMLPMALTQLWVDLPTYRTAKRQALAEGANEERAIHMAEQAVKDTQGSGLPADLPAIMREHKNFTLFMGFLNRSMNLAIRRGKMGGLTPKGLARLGLSAMLIYMVPAAAQVLMWRARGDDDEDPFWLSTFKESLSATFGGALGAREAVSAIRWGYRGPVETAIYGDIGRAAASLFDGDLDEKDFETTLSVAGILLHLPSQQTLETWRGLQAYLDGDATPAAIGLGPPRDN